MTTISPFYINLRDALSPTMVLKFGSIADGLDGTQVPFEGTRARKRRPELSVKVRVKKAMNYFLAKSDPEEYELNDLERDRQTTWDGVKNPQALQAIRAMKAGDRVFFYHSGGQSAIVGMAKVASGARPDPKNEKLAVVDLAFQARLEPPVTLAEIKAEPQFADWLLVRNSRLSTMAAPENFVAWMRKRYPKAKI